MVQRIDDEDNEVELEDELSSEEGEDEFDADPAFASAMESNEQQDGESFDDDDAPSEPVHVRDIVRDIAVRNALEERGIDPDAPWDPTASRPNNDPVELLNGEYSEKAAVEGNREEQVGRSKKKRAETMPTLIGSSERFAALADEIIPEHHPHLATANILYLSTNKPIKGLGAKCSKATPLIKYLARNEEFAEADAEVDFYIIVSLPTFNDMDVKQRRALVDHCLMRLDGDEDEETGKMKWKLREPDVQEFKEVALRHGKWNKQLESFDEALENAEA